MQDQVPSISDLKVRFQRRWKPQILENSNPHLDHRGTRCVCAEAVNSSFPNSLNSNGLCEVAGLVDVVTALDGDVVGQKLEGNGRQDGVQVPAHLR